MERAVGEEDETVGRVGKGVYPSHAKRAGGLS